MHRKMFISILLVCRFVSLDASQDQRPQRAERVRFDLYPHETIFFNEQIRNLKQLPLLRQQEDKLFIQIEKTSITHVNIMPYLGRLNIEENAININENYSNHDDARKTFYRIKQYLITQHGHRILHRVSVSSLA